MASIGGGSGGAGIGPGMRSGVGPPTDGLDSNPYAEAPQSVRTAHGGRAPPSPPASTPPRGRRPPGPPARNLPKRGPGRPPTAAPQRRHPGKNPSPDPP